MTEHHSAMKKMVVSVLLDVSNFYDRISVETLCNRWLDSTYPRTHAALAMQLYLGGRILEAEGEASSQLWTQNGVLAGDPQAPLAAKVYLYEALKAFHKKYQRIDDLSFDVVHRDQCALLSWPMTTSKTSFGPTISRSQKRRLVSLLPTAQPKGFFSSSYHRKVLGYMM